MDVGLPVRARHIAYNTSKHIGWLAITNWRSRAGTRAGKKTLASIGAPPASLHNTASVSGWKRLSARDTDVQGAGKSELASADTGKLTAGLQADFPSKSANTNTSQVSLPQQMAS